MKNFEAFLPYFSTTTAHVMEHFLTPHEALIEEKCVWSDMNFCLLFLLVFSSFGVFTLWDGMNKYLEEWNILFLFVFFFVFYCLYQYIFHSSPPKFSNVISF